MSQSGRSAHSLWHRRPEVLMSMDSEQENLVDPEKYSSVNAAWASPPSTRRVLPRVLYWLFYLAQILSLLYCALKDPDSVGLPFHHC